jgi:hypothetical protein
VAFIQRMMWQARYAFLARQSGYEISMLESWDEAVWSWEYNSDERRHDPMPSPEVALRYDLAEWMVGR